MSETKKDNGFTRWSKKHAELWKFIKFSIAGGSSSAVELIVHMVLLNTAFKVLTSVPVVNDALNMDRYNLKRLSLYLSHFYNNRICNCIYSQSKNYI